MFCSVVPPHLLKHLARAANDPALAQAALQTLMLTERLLGMRLVNERSRPALEDLTGVEYRQVFDCRNSQNLPGRLIATEGKPPADQEGQEAYQGSDATYQLYKRAFGRNSIDGRGMRLINSIHYCNPGEAPVWMGDYSFRPLGDVKVGDEVIGWERVRVDAEKKQSRKYLTRATVLNVMHRRSQLVRVTMESGRVFRCTPNHQWLMFRGKGMDRGSQTSRHFAEVEPGRVLARVIDATPRLMDREKLWAAGYLAGIYDGEGTGSRISQSAEVNPFICARIREVFRTLGIPCSGDYKSIWFTSGVQRLLRQNLVNFVNWCNPAKRDRWLESVILSSRFQHADKIASVRFDGEGDVYALTTTTGNYVVWGYASSNSQKYDNAFWNGRQMVYGDGDGVIFGRFTAAVDVIGHELTHGVTQYSGPGLMYQDQPGALNESLSDCFGCMVKQMMLAQTVDQADWLVGAGLLMPGVKGKALRDMISPGTAYDDPRLGKDPQPADMDHYVQTGEDNGGVHLNSGIPNRAFAVACCTVGGKSWEAVGQVWYRAQQALNDPNMQFAGWAGLTVRQAAALYGTQHAVTQAVQGGWQTVKVNPA